MNPLSTEEIKTRLAERAEEFCTRLFPNGKREGGNFVVGSLAGEPGRSLSVCLRGNKAGMFNDFSSGEKGGDNLVELYRRVHGVEFVKALRACADWLGVSSHKFARPCPVTLEKREWLPYRMNAGELNRCVSFAENLLDKQSVIRDIAKARGWKADTIRNLALDPCIGLHDNKLVYIYPTGAKLRLKPLTPSQKYEGQPFRWLFGAQDSLWRGDRFLKCTETVHITEGETACIALLNAGIDNGTTAIAVAVPGAKAWRPEWARDFRGRIVVIWPDADEAGERFREAIIGSLGGVAEQIKIASFAATGLEAA